MRRARAASVVMAAAILAATSAPAMSAAADPATDGFWYFDVFHIQDAHDAGLTGEGVTIAVIDGQINLDVPTLQGADIELQPSMCWDEGGAPVPPTSTSILADHGTNVVSYLVGTGAGYPGQTGVKGIVPDAKILYFSAGVDVDEGVECYTESGKLANDFYEKAAIGSAIFAAIDAGADIISISLIGLTHAWTELAIAHAVHAGVPIIAGLANDPLAFFELYPSAYNGVVGVQSGDSNALVQGDHIDSATDVLGPGVRLVWQGDSAWDQQRYATGTSLATPIVAGFLALVAQKYPDATGNQLIQTLVRNTGTEDHELIYDASLAVGYGTASATHMLRVDPTQYDDVNLLIADGPADRPTRADIENPPSAENWSLDEPIPELEKPSSGGGIDLVPVLAVVGGGLLLLALVVALIIVLAIRGARKARNTPPA